MCSASSHWFVRVEFIPVLGRFSVFPSRKRKRVPPQHQMRVSEPYGQSLNMCYCIRTFSDSFSDSLSICDAYCSLKWLQSESNWTAARATRRAILWYMDVAGILISGLLFRDILGRQTCCCAEGPSAVWTECYRSE